MVSRLKISLLTIMLCCLGLIFSVGVGKDNDESKILEIQQTEAIEEPSVDKITLKQQEMLDTIVYVRTRNGRGSGTIIDCVDMGETFEYRVLTNAHTINSKFITQIQGVNSLTGKPKVRIIDTGCEIVTFDHQNRSWDHYVAKVVAEDITNDLAILSFVSDQELVVAKIADDDMLKQIRIFDEVFAIGCQLGQAPSPTVGIISQISTESKDGQKRIIYGNTAHIISGSSGGGLFREHNGHYYIIGIPYRISVAPNGQWIPHLSCAISISLAKDFINQNLAICP